MTQLRRLILASLLFVGCRTTIDPQADLSLSHLIEPSQASVVSIAFSPDGRYLATAHSWTHSVNARVSLGGPTPAFVKLWTADDRSEDLAKFEVEDWSYQQVQFSPDGKAIVIRSNNRLLRWDIENQVLNKVPFEFVTAVSPDSRWIGIIPQNAADSVEAKGSVILDASTHQVRRNIPNAFVRAFSPDSSLMVVDNEQSERPEIWRFKPDTKQVSLEGLEDGCWIWSFSSDGKLLAGVPFIDDSSVSLWDTATGERRFYFRPDAGRVRCLAFSPDGRMLAMGCEEGEYDEGGELQLWDVERGAELKTITDDSTWGVTAVAFSPGGAKLAVGNAAGKLQVWDVPKPQVSRKSVTLLDATTFRIHNKKKLE